MMRFKCNGLFETRLTTKFPYQTCLTNRLRLLAGKPPLFGNSFQEDTQTPQSYREEFRKVCRTGNKFNLVQISFGKKTSSL